MEKRKVAVAAVSLILCFAVLISSSYAWISISRSPEISGVSTNIGSNGSLEVALLSDETFKNLSLISSKIGDSAVMQEKTVSNLAWGNVIDLTGESYGLDKISLLPAKLNIFLGENAQKTVSGNLLGFVDYGTDGRIERQNLETVSAVYSEEGFVFNSENQSHGVRGIGTISNISPQQTSLTAARSFVSSYRSSALAETKAAWGTNGSGIIDICERRYHYGEETFTVEDVKVLQDTAVKMKKALDYIDLALRQGIIGYASSMIDDAETFRTLRSAVENTSIPLSMLVSSLPDELPSGFSEWITKTDEKRLELQQVIYACNYIQGSCTWEQISQILSVLIDTEKVFIGDYKISSAEAFENMIPDNILLLSPGSGVFADVADFCGNYSVLFTYHETTAIEAVSASAVSEPHLDWISVKLDRCEPAGTENGVSVSQIEDIYGFAIDLAFRCNQESNLLLQTEAIERYGETIESGQNMGSGSYMEFSSEQLDDEQILMLVDAIRIGFVDGQNNLVAVAKLGTSSYTVEENSLSAPLWLYEFELSESGSLIMGERRTEDNSITTLLNDTPMIITVVIWLDGDNIYNSHAAISNQSMTGILNLQFASSAELNPADISVDVTEEDESSD
ncbi:MAG: hypothetical protein IJ306_07210 [Oscillospiraceae bacterium]|nr:hypothetical protein [Oscillospiraceae bacterium]